MIVSLVDFGFAYSDLIEMPLDEFIEFNQLVFETEQRKEDYMQEQKSLGSNKKEPKPIGAVFPSK